jgi:hypothetical protein
MTDTQLLTIDGWEDYTEHDEGARPLYERPPK